MKCGMVGEASSDATDARVFQSFRTLVPFRCSSDNNSIRECISTTKSVSFVTLHPDVGSQYDPTESRPSPPRPPHLFGYYLIDALLSGVLNPWLPIELNIFSAIRTRLDVIGRSICVPKVSHLEREGFEGAYIVYRYCTDLILPINIYAVLVPCTNFSISYGILWQVSPYMAMH